jgi:glycosyltransferase involved in cell wall biosynthesis
VVVLHDFVLHHFFASYYLESLRSPALYLEEIAYNFGRAGEELGQRALRGGWQLWEQEPVLYPLNKRVLDHSRAVIVHSEFARGLIHRSHPHLPVAKVNLPVRVGQAPADQRELRERYGIPDERVVIGSLGFNSSAKRIEMVLRAVHSLGRADVLYLVVGELGESLRQGLWRLNPDELVRATGYVDWKTFNDYCNLIDIGIDLRYPTMGESSASVCRILGAGKPCVVSDIGWFAELPGDCSVKLEITADEAGLAACLADLIDNPSRRKMIGENARKYVVEHHGIISAGRQYLEFLERVASAQRKRSLERAIIDQTGQAMAEIGVDDDHAELIYGVAEQVASLFRTSSR